MRVDSLLQIVLPYVEVIRESIVRIVELGLSRVHHEFVSVALASVIILFAAMISLKVEVTSAILEISFGAIAATLGFAPSHSLHTLSSMGAVLLMFIAGSEIDVKLLQKYGLKCLVIGMISFTAPMIIITMLLHYSGHEIAQAVLIATALSTTSVAIVYSFIDQANLRGTKLGVIMIASAMVADVLSMVTLTVIFIGANIATALYVLIILAILYLPRIFKRVAGLRYEFELKFIVMVLISLAILSEFLGVHAILTAFILGMFISEIFREHRILEAKIRGLALGFLTPFFFFVAGTNINLTKIFDYTEIALLYTALSIMLKYIFTAIPMAFYAKIKSSKMPMIFAARLTLSTIAAITGLNQGIISADIYSSILISSLLSTMIVAFILNKNE